MNNWNRWRHVRRPIALAALALLGALILYGVADSGGTAAQKRVETAGTSDMEAQGLRGDHALYANVASRVAAGEPYYSAAAAEHRVNGYPLKPFVTVRLPTLAYLFATLGRLGGQIFVAMVGLAAIIAWRRRILAEPELPPYARWAALAIAANMAPILLADWVLIHELLAGALVALGLAVYRPERPWAAALAVLAAAMVRETVLPVAVLLGCFAVVMRDWRAIAAWLAVGLAMLLVMVLHMQAVTAIVRPDDLASPGWNGMGGWHAYIAFVHEVSAPRFLPSWVSALLVPLALLGWATWRSPLGRAMFGVQLMFAAMLMAVARPNNFYWAMLIVPTLHMGVIFAPAALAQLLRSACPLLVSRSYGLPRRVRSVQMSRCSAPTRPGNNGAGSTLTSAS